MSQETPLQRLRRMREATLQGGGPEHPAAKHEVGAQHKKGKLTARERVDLLLDEGSFVELDRFVTQSCTDFEMQEQLVLDDGVETCPRPLVQTLRGELEGPITATEWGRDRPSLLLSEGIS